MTSAFLHRYKLLRPCCAGKDSLQVDPSYLTIEQALADYAALIFHIKDKYEATGSPVIAFGGSYGGMLAAWLRAKYPNAVQVSHGCIIYLSILHGPQDLPCCYREPLADHSDGSQRQSALYL